MRRNFVAEPNENNFHGGFGVIERVKISNSIMFFESTRFRQISLRRLRFFVKVSDCTSSLSIIRLFWTGVRAMSIVKRAQHNYRNRQV